MYKKKHFRLAADQIRPLLDRSRGSAFATDRIMVDGAPVGVMYREPPDNDTDSGWRFMAGDESQDYVDDPDHWAIYDLNTIANYDQAIIPCLIAVGADLERLAGTATFRASD